MSIKPLAISFIAFIGLNLTACGSGTKNDEPKQLTPTPTGNIVDNSAVADYRLVIYGNSHSSQLGSIIETLISDQLPNKTILSIQSIGIS